MHSLLKFLQVSPDVSCLAAVTAFDLFKRPDRYYQVYFYFATLYRYINYGIFTKNGNGNVFTITKNDVMMMNTLGFRAAARRKFG